MGAKVAVIYYSATGNVHALAEAIAAGAADAGADVRLRRVPELAPDAAIDANPDWRAHVEATGHVEIATHEDLTWADAYAFGSPTRYGNVAAQLKQFIDTTGGLWLDGQLSNKAATAFTSAANAQGGNESTLLALYNTFYHWGTYIVPPGYTSPTVFAARGNPYGIAHPGSEGRPSEATLAAARHQGDRLATVAAQLLDVDTIVA
ncbi:NAD(P)H:quinone oxidoreductase [Dactylosporangium sp. NPDC051485]|uniref:NAD(P)H:quinone oxidoreductase n=1 Tax=Dactylosporangium sp. NPDC051485 TaxID=3154846 RepID=UPI003423F151